MSTLSILLRLTYPLYVEGLSRGLKSTNVFAVLYAVALVELEKENSRLFAVIWPDCRRSGIASH